MVSDVCAGSGEGCSLESFHSAICLRSVSCCERVVEVQYSVNMKEEFGLYCIPLSAGRSVGGP